LKCFDDGVSKYPDDLVDKKRQALSKDFALEKERYIKHNRKNNVNSCFILRILVYSY